MSFIRYYLFWPIYIGLWVRRYSSTTRSRDEGSFRPKTIVEHELDHKYWRERHFWAPLIGLFLYSFAWIFFALLMNSQALAEAGGVNLTIVLQLLCCYMFFFFIFSPTSILLTLIYWYVFIAPDHFETLAPTMGSDWLMGSLLSIYRPIIEFGFFGLPNIYF